MPVTSRLTEFISAVRATAAASFEQTAKECVADLKDNLSTPYPPASQPGEDPHKRTGNLQDGVQSVTTEDDEAVETQIGSSRAEGNPDVPVILEFGLGNMKGPRPYMSSNRNEWGPKFKDNAAVALKELTGGM